MSHSRLVPASKAEGTAHLAACLVLVAPTGMTADEREEWLKAARMTLSGMPADLLERGCEVARRSCRFPSDIVPTIMEAVGKTWEGRKADAAWQERKAQMNFDPQPEAPALECVDPKLIRDLIKSIGQ